MTMHRGVCFFGIGYELPVRGHLRYTAASSALFRYNCLGWLKLNLGRTLLNSRSKYSIVNRTHDLYGQPVSLD